MNKLVAGIAFALVAAGIHTAAAQRVESRYVGTYQVHTSRGSTPAYTARAKVFVNGQIWVRVEDRTGSRFRGRVNPRTGEIRWPGGYETNSAIVSHRGRVTRKGLRDVTVARMPELGLVRIVIRMKKVE